MLRLVFHDASYVRCEKFMMRVGVCVCVRVQGGWIVDYSAAGCVEKGESWQGEQRGWTGFDRGAGLIAIMIWPISAQG